MAFELLYILVTNGLVNLEVTNNKVEAYVPESELEVTALGNVNVRSALFDKQGRLWVAIYGGGLNLFDTERRVFTKRYLNDPNNKLLRFRNKLMKSSSTCS